MQKLYKMKVAEFLQRFGYADKDEVILDYESATILPDGKPIKCFVIFKAKDLKSLGRDLYLFCSPDCSAVAVPNLYVDFINL